MRHPRWRAALAAAAIAGLAVPALTATAASAGVQPGVPSQSQMNGHRHELRPEAFTLTFSPEHQNGSIDAYGPVYGHNGTDKQVSNVQDSFVFGKNSVNVLHTDVSNVPVKVNWKSCTATGSAKGNWLFDGGTGKYENAFGYGHFTYTEWFRLAKTKHGKCCDPNPDHATDFRIVVRGYGQATSGHGHHK